MAFAGCAGGLGGDSREPGGIPVAAPQVSEPLGQKLRRRRFLTDRQHALDRP